MSTIVTIGSGDLISNSRSDLNTNFSNLNTDKMETSVLDTDTSLAANSDSKVATQKATKTYVDSVASPVGKSWNEYAVGSSGSDAYAITISGVSSYTAGQTFKFKSDIANTGACSLNVNGLGAKTIKKDVSSDLATGDILSGQGVVVVYDGTNMQLVSLTAGVKDATKLTGIVPNANLPDGSYWDFSLKLGTDFTVTNSSTLATVTGFTIPVLINETWLIEVYGAIEESNPIGKAKFDLTTSGTWQNTAYAWYQGTYFNSTDVLTTVVPTLPAGTTNMATLTVGNDTAGTYLPIKFTYIAAMTASGNINFQIANAAAAAGRTSTLKAGAYMLGRRIKT